MEDFKTSYSHTMIINKLLADIQIFPAGGAHGIGCLGLESGSGCTPETAPSTFTKIISGAIGLISMIGIIWFAFVIITGAISIITAGGDKGALEGAKKKITNGLIGLVVVIAGLFVIDLIGYLIGIPDILNFGTLFGKLNTL
jgi:hypothetical protein